jgi:two-component system copper resistance phosphate regulon response regulator CusR
MHILVVEDEKKVASFIKRGLEAANYSVDVEHDGEAGLNRLLRLGNIKIALVSSAEISESEQLKVLSDSLCREDLKAAVFDNEKEAIIWIISTV